MLLLKSIKTFQDLSENLLLSVRFMYFILYSVLIYIYMYKYINGTDGGWTVVHNTMFCIYLYLNNHRKCCIFGVCVFYCVHLFWSLSTPSVANLFECANFIVKSINRSEKYFYIFTLGNNVYYIMEYHILICDVFIKICNIMFRLNRNI